MNDEFRVTVSRLALSLYQFSHLLIPDRLQAQQIAIDALAQLGVAWAPMKMALERKKFDSDFKKFQLKAFQASFNIARARAIHLGQQTAKNVSPTQVWQDLNFEERAVLYLFYRQKLSKHEIAELIDRSLYDVMAILAGARDAFSLYMVETPSEEFGHA